ncbi:MAG: endonuclease/exonuclease/phosphatase family protein, partial [Bacteroidota bacterium]
IKIETAIAELRTHEGLREADIVLLQEMDEVGTRRIADSLQLNFLYYPATINSTNQTFFGNAILSRWPLQNERKYVLPHPNPHNGGRRIAISAKIDLGNKTIRIYNIHSETIVLKGKKRLQQHAYLAQHLTENTDTDYLILGGDFNTFHKRDLRRSVALFESIGLQWCTPELGSTASALGGIIKKQFDHIFVKGFTPLGSGKNENSEVGDHLPIWTLLKIDNSIKVSPASE